MNKSITLNDVNNARLATRIIHPVYGDLSGGSAVLMRRWSNDETAFSETNSIFIHLTVTGCCNANCSGCINTSITAANSAGSNKRISFINTVPERDARAILSLARLHPGERITICLYGGEPLLEAEKIENLVNIIDSSGENGRIRYLIYTNGELIGEALARYPRLMQRIWLYAVSIDGQEKQHDSIRKGTSLSRIHKNLELLGSARDGEVLIWSTLREEQSLGDCFEEFLYLHRKGIANHFFWHWVEVKEEFENFSRYLESYEADLKAIMKIYLSSMAEAAILPIVHVNELVLYLLTGRERGSTGCGVECAGNYDIINGKLHACADLPPDYEIGVIDADGTIRMGKKDLSPLIEYKKSLGCAQCGAHPYCGGRCPVQALQSTPGRLFQYCQLMRLHVGVIQDFMPEIMSAMRERGITAQQIYDRSAVIAQFTDVTP